MLNQGTEPWYQYAIERSVISWHEHGKIFYLIKFEEKLESIELIRTIWTIELLKRVWTLELRMFLPIELLELFELLNYLNAFEFCNLELIESRKSIQW